MHILCKPKPEESENASQEIFLRFCFSSACQFWRHWFGLITRMRFGHETSLEYSQLLQGLQGGVFGGLSALLARGSYRIPGKFFSIEPFPICLGGNVILILPLLGSSPAIDCFSS